MSIKNQTLAAEHNARGVQLSESGRLDEAIECFREAVRLDHRFALAPYNLGNALMAAGQRTQACAAYRDAVAIDPDFTLAYSNLGLALLEGDDIDGAMRALRRAVELDPQAPAAVSSFAIALIRKGELRGALAMLERNLARDPRATRDLSLKAVALERLGEFEGARRLLDYDRLIVSSRPAVPPGYQDIDAFNAALAEHVLSHPTLVRSPDQHATRGGLHSGDLLLDATPVITALEDIIERTVEHYVERGPPASGHPFLASVPESVVVTAWAVVLERGGFQIPHVHPAGWLSGVYYVRVPAPPPERPHEGWIEFGQPDPALRGEADPPTRLVDPEAGSMVLFPSYVYHRTLPFDAPGPRISIAFDVMPGEPE